MRRISVIGIVVAMLIGMGSTAALAQSGHFLTGGANAPTCVDIGTQVECSGSVAGLGGTTFEITIEATGIASVQCRNPGGNIAPGQDTTVTLEGTTDPLPTPRNGRSNFTVTTDEPTVDSSACPNPQWTAEVTDVAFTEATLSLFENGTLADQITVSVQ